MRASRKLEKCTEICKYNISGLCAFGLRDRVGYFLDDNVKLECLFMLDNALAMNTVEAAKSIVRGKLD